MPPKIATPSDPADTLHRLLSRRRKDWTAVAAVLATFRENQLPAIPILARVLVLAAASGQTGIVLTLLARGIDPDATDTTGDTALMAATRSNQIATLEVLLAAHATPDRPDRSGWTALTHAVLHGARAAMDCLLDHGADPTVPDVGGLTPLSLAAMYDVSATTVLTGLLDTGRFDGAALAAALDSATAIGCATGVRTLLAAGADPNHAQEKSSPLMLTSGDLEIVRMLLAHGADPNQTDAEGRSALSSGIRYSRPTPDTIRTLIEGGADPAHRDHAGRTALHRFAESGREDLVAALDETLARPQGAAARRRLLHRLSPARRQDWLPRCCAIEVASSAPAWNHRP